MSAQNIATSLIFFITKILSMKSVSLKEINESVVFHFSVLFIFPDMQMQVWKKYFSSKYEL